MTIRKITISTRSKRRLSVDIDDRMFNTAAVHIHKMAVVTHTHTVLHNPKHRINRWCFHYVTFVFGVKHWASVLFLAAGAMMGPRVFTLLSGD